MSAGTRIARAKLTVSYAGGDIVFNCPQNRFKIIVGRLHIGKRIHDAVTFLWRAAGNPDVAGPGNSFRDVKNGSYYEKAVNWAVVNSITSGTNSTGSLLSEHR